MTIVDIVHLVKKAAAAAFLDELSSAALGAVVAILPNGGNLTVGFGHKSLQLLFKKLIRSLGGSRRHGSPGFPILLAAGSLAVLGLTLTDGLRLQTLDGQIDLSVFKADDLNLNLLTFGQVLADIADISVRHLRDMYQTGLVIRQGYKGTEVGDGFDSSL
jgi:hypothetical protein